MSSVNSDEFHSGKIDLKRSDGLKHDLVSVFTGMSPANLFKVKKKGGEIIHVTDVIEAEHDHGNIKLHRSDGLNCDIIRVFKSMSERDGVSLQKKASPSTDRLADKSTKSETQNSFPSSAGGVNAPIFTINELSNSPTSARIVHMSNTHNHLSRSMKRNFFPEGDILIHSGGFTISGTEEEYAQFDEWLGSVKDLYHYRIIVAGLSDVKQCGNDWDFVKAKLPNATHVLCHSEVTVLGMRIYGAPWHWAHEPNYSIKLGAPSSTSGRFDETPQGVNILVTHGPSFGKLDFSPGNWSNISHGRGDRIDLRSQNLNAGQVQSGSRELKETIQQVKPGLHLHGLCAESRGVLHPMDQYPLTVNSCLTDPSGSILCSCPHVIRCNLMYLPGASEEYRNASHWDFSLDSLM